MIVSFVLGCPEILPLLPKICAVDPEIIIAIERRRLLPIVPP